MTEETQETPIEEVETEEAESGVYEIEEQAIQVAQRTMVGDLRDVCLQIMRDPKTTGKAWKDMSEDEQKDTVQKITDRVTDAVVQGVRIISANGQRQIIGTLEQVTNKDGMKSVIKTSAHDELRHELNDNVGSCVAIVLSGAEEYIGVGDKPKIDKDQPELLPDGEPEELMEKVRAIILEKEKCTTSFIQRELQIGYNRAARIVEILEEQGFISPANELGKRTILGDNAAATVPTEAPEEETYDRETGEIGTIDAESADLT